MKLTVEEPPRSTTIVHECDVCVLGGSCTGVFAAVKAARLGAKVVLIERLGMFGGVATASLVNVWHSPLDTRYERPIIGGLTIELINRLDKRGAVQHHTASPHWAFAFNPYEMMIELDRLVIENNITPMLHSAFVAPVVEDGRLDAVLIENKSDRQAVRARFFIDATGDADVAHRCGSACYKAAHAQPSTTCAVLNNWSTLGSTDVGSLLLQHAKAYNLPVGFAWGAPVPGTDQYMLAATRVRDLDPSNADELTRSEIEGRRQVGQIMAMIRQHAPHASIGLTGLPARIGLRESRHVHCGYQLTGDDVLYGRRFDDAIANGSYRVDVHHQDKPGITLQYLDGTQSYCVPGKPNEESRWREHLAEDPTFYQIPYRSIVPGNLPNLLIAGRMLDADPLAHAAVRVMVNMNQTGEAAGVASVLAMRGTGDVRTINPADLRDALREGGSIVID